MCPVNHRRCTRRNVTIHQAILHGERILSDSGVADPRWNAERVLLVALQQPRSKIYAELSRELTPRELSVWNRLLAKRAAHYPLAYLEGSQEFFGRDFVVDPSVLIPRPETEELIHIVLGLEMAEKPLILDLGSGSGNIPVTLVLEIPGSRVIALERSSDAIKVLKRNLRENVQVVRGDFLFPPFRAGLFDCITANIPYVEKPEFETLPTETLWEPKDALLVESLEGTYSDVMNASARLLKASGSLIMEFGFGQSERLRFVASRISQLNLVDIRNDQRGIPRFLLLQKQ